MGASYPQIDININTKIPFTRFVGEERFSADQLKQSNYDRRITWAFLALFSVPTIIPLAFGFTPCDSKESYDKLIIMYSQ